jgi:hypothetical protein
LNKIKFFTRIILVTGLMLSFLQPAQAAPLIASQFYGEIHVLDNSPIVGSVINAYVPGVIPAVGTAVVIQSGSNLVYSISVLGDDPDTTTVKEGGLPGEVVTFRFGTRILGTGFWAEGTNVLLNFHPPQALPGTSYSGNEGSSIQFSALANDWGNDVATYAWNMDSNPADYEITGQSPSVTFPQSGVFTIGLRVTDGLAGEGIATVQVTVNNVAPTVAALNSTVTVSEGTLANNAGTYYDPGADTIQLTASVGTVVNHGDGTWAWSHTPTDGPAQSQTITITATDQDGGIGTTTFGLVVNNGAPVGVLGNTGPVLEGSPVSISFSGQGDPSPQDVAAGFHYAFACDNGSLASATYANSSASPSTTCVFSEPPSSHNVRGRIIDKDNGFTEYTTNVIVGNANPTATADQSTVTVNEGSTATNTGTFSDPGMDPLTIYTEYGTVMDNGNGTWSWSYFAGSGPGDSRNIVVQVADGQGGFGGVTFALVVNNVAPTANAGGPYEVYEGQPVNFIGIATDPGLDDIGRFDYYWDFDYISPNFTADASGSATVSPTYADEGVYVAAFRVEDSQFAVGLGTTTVTILNTPPTNVSPGGPYTVAPYSLLNMYGSATCASVDTCTYAWDLDNDGLFDDYVGPIASYTWSAEGTYTIRLQVTDDDGTSAIGTSTVTVSTLFTHSIPLVVGWNLISFNLHPTNTAITAVLANIAGHYNLVYAWDASGATSGNWLKYDPGALFGNTLTTLDETRGIWINVTVADTLNVVGTPVPTSSIPLWDNAGGWNLVSYPSAAALALPDALSLHGVGTNFTLIYAYHAANVADLWKLFDRNALFGNDLTQMTPGWGYWIYATADSTWVVNY